MARDIEKQRQWRRTAYRLNPEKYRAQRRKYYRAHRKQVLAKYAEWQKRPEVRKHLSAYLKERRRANSEYAYLYKLRHPCVDCGESDPRCLEFDHVNGNKSANISSMIGKAIALNRIAAEIQKCEVRCSNCHRKKHSARPYMSGTPRVLTHSRSAA